MGIAQKSILNMPSVLLTSGSSQGTSPFLRVIRHFKHMHENAGRVSKPLER
jgi:hypothetical protein